MKPITPDEVAEVKSALIPDFVIEAFNELIVEGYRGGAGSVTVKQNDAIERIISKMESSTDAAVRSVANRSTIFNRGWLDVERTYRAVGWKVEYDKPGYNEMYDAFFVFSKESKRIESE